MTRLGCLRRLKLITQHVDACAKNYYAKRRFRRAWTHLRTINRLELGVLLLLVLFVFTSPPFLGYLYYRSIVAEVPVAQSITEKARAAGDAYTVVILSQPRRLRTLQTVVSHYGRCPSIREIVITWGDDVLPDQRQFRSAAPVRLRLSQPDSLNNRFLPDPLISTEAVLSLDDDVLLLCSDLEKAFRVWQDNKQKLVGFYPRLILAPSGAPVQYIQERVAFGRGEYNAMLTVAMFYNVALMAAYWRGQGVAAFGRSVVDRLSNCEDILMNYVAEEALQMRRGSSGGGEEAAVVYVRPRRRMDLSQLTSVGISRNSGSHLAKRLQCTLEISEYLRRGASEGPLLPELPRTKFRWTRLDRPPICWIPLLGCLYM